MSYLYLPPVTLLIPLMLVGAWFGYRRSWIREMITGLVLAGVLIGFERLRSLAYTIVRGVAGLVDRLAHAVHFSGVSFVGLADRFPATLFSLLCLALFIAAAYYAGHYLGSRQPEGERLHRSTGLVLGAVNVLLLVTLASKYVISLIHSSRLSNLSVVPGGSRGLSIEFPAFPSTSRLIDWSTIAIIIVVAVAVVWGFNRFTRFRG